MNNGLVRLSTLTLAVVTTLVWGPAHAFGQQKNNQLDSPLREMAQQVRVHLGHGNISGAIGGGKVVVQSGATGKRLIRTRGAVAGERRGTSPSYAGDVDGDGIGDLISGARQNNEGALKGRKVYRHNGVGEGKLLRPWTSRRSGDTLGFDATGIGDPIGDGKIDFLLTSAWARRRVRRQDGFLSSREENVKTEPSK